jgi:heparin binding hemagglutinin HbhA
MAAETNTKIPNPLYAAAAVGDLAYQRLRKLPATVADLRERVTRTDLDAEKLRGIAQRNANALVTSAQAAQERAQAIYTKLVAHGEEVVRGRRVIHATIGVVPEAQPASQPAAKVAKPVAKKATKAAN